MKIMITAMTALLFFVSCEQNKNKMSALNTELPVIRNLKEKISDTRKTHRSEESGIVDYFNSDFRRHTLGTRRNGQEKATRSIAADTKP
jgi:hypothetical protein